MTKAPFDPWDWLGVCWGGFIQDLDCDMIAILEGLRDGDGEDPRALNTFGMLARTLLCNTDAFEFDDDPTQLRFVGDERFSSLDQLIDSWDTWYGEHYR